VAFETKGENNGWYEMGYVGNKNSQRKS